jgi:hypothetical protein
LGLIGWLLLLLLLLLLQDINWEKIRYMTEKLGLTAWHVNAPDERPPVSACICSQPLRYRSGISSSRHDM